MKIIIILSLFITQVYASNKVCMAAIYGAQINYQQTNGEFASEFEEIEDSVGAQCPRSAIITLAPLENDRFIAIAKFNEELWVVNETKEIVKGNMD